MTYSFPIAVENVFDVFAREYREVRLVGGCVRDLILGEKPKDWDMATPALPHETMAILEGAGLKPFDLSNGHGTISVLIQGETIEITTLRIDEQTDGRHATVKFTDSWMKDAERRDFTFNAMSMDRDCNVFDYFGGEQDLKDKRIRFVGSAHKRIEEDYLRILRYFRFAQRFNMKMDMDDLETIIDTAHGLEKVSGERIWMEMQKILVGRDVDQYLRVMAKAGVLQEIGMKLKPSGFTKLLKVVESCKDVA